MYSTTRLMVDPPHMIQEMMVVLSYLERGADMIASGNAARRLASQRTRVEISRSKLASITPELVSNTNASVVSDGQGRR